MNSLVLQQAPFDTLPLEGELLPFVVRTITLPYRLKSDVSCWKAQHARAIVREDELKEQLKHKSSWKKPYTDRGIRKILEKYTEKAGIEHSISPHKLRHFLFTWMKKQGVDDALIQPYSGHESRQSLEIYSKLSLNDAQPM